MALKAWKDSFQYLILPYWSEKVGEREEGSTKMAIHPVVKGKTPASCQKPQKACFLLFNAIAYIFAAE